MSRPVLDQDSTPFRVPGYNVELNGDVDWSNALPPHIVAQQQREEAARRASQPRDSTQMFVTFPLPEDEGPNRGRRGGGGGGGIPEPLWSNRQGEVLQRQEARQRAVGERRNTSMGNGASPGGYSSSGSPGSGGPRSRREMVAERERDAADHWAGRARHHAGSQGSPVQNSTVSERMTATQGRMRRAQTQRSEMQRRAAGTGQRSTVTPPRSNLLNEASMLDAAPAQPSPQQVSSPTRHADVAGDASDLLDIYGDERGLSTYDDDSYARARAAVDTARRLREEAEAQERRQLRVEQQDRITAAREERRSLLDELEEAQRLAESQERSALRAAGVLGGASRPRDRAGSTGNDNERPAIGLRPGGTGRIIDVSDHDSEDDGAGIPSAVRRLLPPTAEEMQLSRQDQGSSTPPPPATHASGGTPPPSPIPRSASGGNLTPARLQHNRTAGAPTRRDEDGFAAPFATAFDGSRAQRLQQRGRGRGGPSLGGRGGNRLPPSASPGGGRQPGTNQGGAGGGEWELNDFSYEALLELGSMAVSTGLDSKQLALYKPVPYAGRKGSHFKRLREGANAPNDSQKRPDSAASSASTVALDECTVCLDEVEIGAPSLCLPCGHTFHHQCIVQWLARTNQCPTCRREIPRKGKR